jgi:hypothetical protein
MMVIIKYKKNGKVYKGRILKKMNRGYIVIPSGSTKRIWVAKKDVFKYVNKGGK